MFMKTTPNYNRLTFWHREEISRGIAGRKSLSLIAFQLDRPTSTITREVNANGGRYQYRAELAEVRAFEQRVGKNPNRKISSNSQLEEYIHSKLRRQWSPDQIAKRLKQEYPANKAMPVSHESIYTYIYLLPRGELKKELISHLRQHRKLRENRKGQRAESRRTNIPDLISIDERPEEVADRTIPGHWESDLIVGKDNQSAIGTIVERTTRTVILVPLKAKTAVSVRQAFARELKSLPKQMKLSMTHDRGSEMSQHKLFTAETKIKVYFAHPQSPWERGTNENTNGLVRQYFPKGTDLSGYSRKQIKQVQDLLNGRPRKALGYATPYEVFNKLVALEV